MRWMRKLTDNVRQYGMLRGSGSVAWTMRWRLPFGVFVRVMRRHPDVFETIDPETGNLIACNKRGHIVRPEEVS